MARNACRYLPTIEPREVRWVLIEATDRILPEVAPGLGDYARRVLERRGVEVKLECQLRSVERALELSDGDRLEADTVVWVAGVRPNPVVAELGVPTDDQGRVEVDPTLRISDGDGAWAAGDVAAVPDLVAGGICPPTAQHALRQGRQLAANLAAIARGEPAAPFRYQSRGEFLTLGRQKGVGQLLGRNLRGRPPWLLRRAYYWSVIPTTNRKLRVLADWTIGLPFRHDVVQLSPFDPRAGRSREEPGEIQPDRQLAARPGDDR